MSSTSQKLSIRQPQDVVVARGFARVLASWLGFGEIEQVGIATAVSEISRNALRYAGGGVVSFEVAKGPPTQLKLEVVDEGKGIADLPAVLEGRYVSTTGMGRGLAGSRRLMDGLEVESRSSGTRVRMHKIAPLTAPPPSLADLEARAARWLSEHSVSWATEAEQQSTELLRTLEALEGSRAQVEQLNRELEETNRGVVALYAELDEKAEELRKASEAKSRFLSTIGHELRTPISSILSLARLLLERTDGPLTFEQERQVSFIRRGAGTLGEMINDLLDLAKIEAGKVTLRPHAFTVAELFGGLRGMFRPMLTNERVALVFDPPPEDLPALFTDEAKLSQVLRNFISNALKFTEAGEVRVSASVTAPGRVQFAVKDTGVGIAPEHQEKVFEEFTQIDSAQQRRVTGTGLGLPLSRKFAALLGGEVGLASALGEGSTFWVEIAATLSPEGRAPAADVTMEKILVVDDDEVARYLLRRHLEGEPYQVLEATNGEEGLALARRERPRLVILDLVMPGGASGFEVLEALRADPALSATPVVVHSSKSLTEQERAVLSAHGATVVTKDASDSAASKRELQRALTEAGLRVQIKG